MTKEASNPKAGLYAAFVAAQAELPAPKKTRQVSVKMKSGGTYKFSYAEMGPMVETAKPIISKHGLGFTQFVQNGEAVTRILHVSGEHMDCPLPIPNLPNAAQEAGSIITYFKRYSFCAAFGLVADEEDDANIAEGNGYETQRQAAPRHEPEAAPEMIEDGQVALIHDLLTPAKKTLPDILAAYKVQDVRQLTKSKADAAIKRLEELGKEAMANA